MAPSSTNVRRPLVGVIFGALAGTMLWGGPSANADPATPGCMASDLARVSAGVASATADYLVGHPDVDVFFTNLQDKPANEVPTIVDNYLEANPQVETDLEGIRQPLNELTDRCDVSEEASQ
jgi:hemophore-related protein